MTYIVNELFRFRMLVVGIYVGIAISSTYGFSIFTEHLKNKYDFTQSDITTISTVGNCVGYLCFFGGMLFDYAGPKVVLPIAGFLGFFGYLLFGLAFDDAIPKQSSREANVVMFSVFNAILYLGCPSLDVATLMPLMLNFPLDRGFMVIIQKTFAGLGTSIIMAYFNGWFRDGSNGSPNYSGYVYFIGCQIFFCAVLGACFIDLPPYYMTQYRQARVTEEEKAERAATLQVYMSQSAPRRRLYIGCALVGACLTYFTTTSITTGYVATSTSAFMVLAIVSVVLMSLFATMALPMQLFGRYAPIAVPHEKFPSLGYASASEEQEQHQTVSTSGKSTEPVVAVEEEAEQEEEEDGERKAEAQPVVVKTSVGDPQYQGSFWSHLLTLDLWLLWITFFGLWGTGTVMQMNAAQIYRSKNYGVSDNSRLTLYVALMGVGSAFGRVISGVVDMTLTKWRKEGRTRVLTTTFLPVGCVLLFAAYLFFAVIPADGLVLPFLLGSIGTGMGWGLGALSVRIIYAEDIGKHYNFMFSSGFICTIALNRFMFGEMYDNKAAAQHTTPHCNKPSCVRDQMFILMSVNVLSAATGLLVHLRYRRFVHVERAALAARIEKEAASENTTIATN